MNDKQRIAELEKQLENALKLSEMFIEWGQKDNKNKAFADAFVGYLVAGQEFHKLLTKGKSDFLTEWLEGRTTWS